jgi:putative oxidoreductase
MDIVRTFARPMLASTFIVGGYNVLRDPTAKARATEEVAGTLPVDPSDDAEQLVTLTAAVQVGAGAMLALGKFPRLSSLALAASLVPSAAAASRFWTLDDERSRSEQAVRFLTDVSALGGLLIAAMDTEGRPSVGYRASRAGRRARTRAEKAAATAQERAARGRVAAERAAAKGGATVSQAPVKAAEGAARGVGAVASALPIGH